MARPNAKKLSDRIDLHDLSVHEALGEFVYHYNLCVSTGSIRKIEVIHGYGSSGVGGRIKTALRRYLKIHSLNFVDVTLGDDLGNPGITIVYPSRELPRQIDPAVLLDTKSQPVAHSRVHEPIRQTEIEKHVLRALNTPKTEEKLLVKLRGEFRAPVIRAELKRLVRAGIVEESVSNGAKHFGIK
jgi:hypothetical protein